MKKYIWIVVFMFILVCGLSGCKESEPLTYQLTVTGTAEKAGVIQFLGYEINVYQDEASNSCGDCVDQPVHLYVGATAEDAVNAIADVVTRADDLWVVTEQSGDQITLEEKKQGTVRKKEITEPLVPAGMTIEDNYGNQCVGTEEATEASWNKTIYDLDGDAVSVPVDPQKIAAVYGPSYEAMVVLGQEDKVVVCSDVQKDDFPWATEVFSGLKDLPCLENVHSAVNVEEMMVYEPDIVFSFPRPNELKQMEQLGVAAVSGTTTRTLAETKDLLLFYAHALNSEAVERAEDYGTYFDEKYQYVTDRTASLPDESRPKVYYAGIDLLTTYGVYSDIPQLIEAAGGTAVSKELKAGNHSQINFEQLAAWNPDYIFIDHGGMNENETVEQILTDTYSNKQYSEIQAVVDRQVYLSPSGVFYWDMGLQKILLLMYVAKTVHPELFADLDMAQEVQEFYQRFYDYPLTYEQAQAILDRQDP